MEGLFACLPGKLAWRRRFSQASDFRRHLGPRSSLPGGQLAWETVKQTPPGKSVGDEGRGHGGAEGDDGSPPPIGTPTPSSVVTDDCCDKGPGQKQIPPKAPMPPPSMEVALGQEPLLLPSDGAPPGSHQGPAVAALEGLDKKEKSFTYLRHVSCSTTKQDIEYMPKFPLYS
ncbi:unnamed protein product [Miscanthus lutarioriparius]|uniref:Uncharacterized protein n=1 Tax=Miscanthus lutarioriparius TaxID=422564 RepID=A0A811RK70_9POAL|nr:unnamed protein product [Miscanthus lutarioriparius]